MQSDGVTKVLLAAIVLCLLLLIAQQFNAGAQSGAAASAEPRYHVMTANMRKGGAMLIRSDLNTGTVWRKSLVGDGPWVVVDEETRGSDAPAD
jgi:hypothetical protein